MSLRFAHHRFCTAARSGPPGWRSARARIAAFAPRSWQTFDAADSDLARCRDMILARRWSQIAQSHGDRCSATAAWHDGDAASVEQPLTSIGSAMHHRPGCVATIRCAASVSTTLGMAANQRSASTRDGEPERRAGRFASGLAPRRRVADHRSAPTQTAIRLRAERVAPL